MKGDSREIQVTNERTEGEAQGVTGKSRQEESFFEVLSSLDGTGDEERQQWMAVPFID